MMHAIGIDVGGSSVKLAGMSREKGILWTAQSRRYSQPDRQQLIATIESAVAERIAPDQTIVAAGACVPGILDESGRTVIESINLPGLIGIPLQDLIEAGLRHKISRFICINDALAAGIDILSSGNLQGRVAVIALGTGVGMSVLDSADKPLFIDGTSPGHIGQFDVSLEPDGAPIGPDGGAGSLEGYIGAPALIEKYGSMENFFKSASVSDMPIRALSRAIRICHAIYRPNHVVLAGGTGVRLGSIVAGLKALVDMNLTRIAREGWTLGCAEHDFHAAIGAARAAMSALP